MLISTLLLPLDDDLHMPPAKKTQLTKEEIEVLTWWVKSGAHTGKTLAQSNAPQNVLTAVNNFIPEEIRQKQKIERLQKIAEQKAKAKKERETLSKKWQTSLPKKLMPLLRFVSPYDTSIHFSSVSLQQEFGDSEFAALAQARIHFTSIDISHSAITGRTIEMLPTSPKLTTLRLADTKLKSADLAPLAKLKQLETLSLHSTQIDKSALPTLAKIKSLRQLYLWNTNLSSEEIAQFAKQHPNIQINY
jgi:Leucine-rich repeat (LRR) protein